MRVLRAAKKGVVNICVPQVTVLGQVRKLVEKLAHETTRWIFMDSAGSSLGERTLVNGDASVVFALRDFGAGKSHIDNG